MNSKKMLSITKLNKKDIIAFSKKIFRVSKTFLLKNKDKILIGVLGIIAILIALTIFVNIYYSNKLSPFIKNSADNESLEFRPTAIILGAGLNSDGTPSDMLKDRLDVGYQLLMTGRVSKLILSGDNREVNYNEPESMKNYLIDKGVSANSLVADYAGRRTYDSCYRAKEIFGQTKVYIVTQEFHIVRAVYLCRSLGIDAIGITADLRTYQDLWTNILRDYIAMPGAVWDVKISRPQPVLGEKIQIN